MNCLFVLLHCFAYAVGSYGNKNDISQVKRSTRNVVSGFPCLTDHKRVGDKCIPCIGSFSRQCLRPCPSGWYGFGCRKKCSCPHCNSITGLCSHEKPTNPRAGSDTGSVIGGVVGSLVFLLLVVTSLICTRIRLRRRIALAYESSQIEEGKRNSRENVYIDMLGVEESSSTKPQETGHGDQDDHSTIYSQINKDIS